jgi:hypothetical protein
VNEFERDVKKLAVLEKAACKAGKAGKTLYVAARHSVAYMLAGLWSNRSLANIMCCRVQQAAESERGGQQDCLARTSSGMSVHAVLRRRAR